MKLEDQVLKKDRVDARRLFQLMHHCLSMYKQRMSGLEYDIARDWLAAYGQAKEDLEHLKAKKDEDDNVNRLIEDLKKRLTAGEINITYIEKVVLNDEK